MNVTLVGMSGTGKSYIGKKVAERLGLLCVDIDHSLEEDYGKELPAIIKDIGERGFIAAETAATIAQSEGRDGLLISTGGSIIYSEVAVRHLRAISRVVYLRLPATVLLERIQTDPNRKDRIVGLSGKTVAALIDERAPLYEKAAHVSVDLTNLETDAAVAAVIQAAVA